MATAPTTEQNEWVDLQREAIRSRNEATFWRTLALRKTHPLQLWILHVLETELAIASPNKLSELGDHPLGNVSYHVKELVKTGMVELVKTEPRRGAVEHFYRAIPREERAG
jgi:hypothetical protein